MLSLARAFPGGLARQQKAEAALSAQPCVRPSGPVSGPLLCELALPLPACVCLGACVSGSAWISSLPVVLPPACTASGPSLPPCVSPSLRVDLSARPRLPTPAQSRFKLVLGELFSFLIISTRLRDPQRTEVTNSQETDGIVSFNKEIFAKISQLGLIN